MKVRNARTEDAKVICSLINYYAEQDKMLFRSIADIYENMQTFVIAELGGSVVGCCSLEVIWADLAEIKSLAVEEAHTRRGIGTKLVAAAVQQACGLGVPRVFALTLIPKFFEKQGFERIGMDELPMKVWSDCARCPKQQECDEIAVIKNIGASS